MTNNMPWLEHAIELRRRLILSLAGFGLAVIICYQLAPIIQDILIAPLAKVMATLRQAEHPARMIYTQLTEAFVTRLKLAMFGGLIMAFPWIAFHLWRFAAPGLYKNERKVFLFMIVLSPVLFMIGAAVAYFFVFPAAWAFFLAFETNSGAMPLQLEAKISEYVSTAIQLITAFGVCFQLPLVLLILLRSHIISRETLVKGRKYAFILILLVAALITPPDLLSPILLTIPIYALYESSIILARLGKMGDKQASPPKQEQARRRHVKS